MISSKRKKIGEQKCEHDLRISWLSWGYFGDLPECRRPIPRVSAEWRSIHRGRWFRQTETDRFGRRAWRRPLCYWDAWLFWRLCDAFLAALRYFYRGYPPKSV